MDDIAKHLAMSKKTIYQHFADKNALIVDLMRNKMENQACLVEKSAENSKDAIQEVLMDVTRIQEMLSKMNPVLFYDLQKYHPQAWLHFKSFKEQNLFKLIQKNLKRGISEGNYRKEINIEILTRMRIKQIDDTFNHTTYPINMFTMSKVMIEITEHFLYGICTLKGHKLINKYKQIIEEE